jgi:hypothetical protein
LLKLTEEVEPMMGKKKTLETAPDWLESTTATAAVPCVVMFAAGIVAEHCVAVQVVVQARAAPFH